MKRRPPVLGQWLLSRITNPGIRYAVMGDFEEHFLHKCATSGAQAAALWYWGQVLKSLPSFLKESVFWGLVMSLGHARVAVRSLAKYKSFSAINIFGLAVGLASFSVMWIYVQHERSFDRFHSNSERIYRLVNDITSGDRVNKQAATSPAMGPALERAFAEVERAVRFRRTKAVFSFGRQRFIEDQVFYTDAGFFDVFSFRLRAGDSNTALREPNSVVIGPALARRLFGAEDALGKMITINNEQTYRVTGLLDEAPTNSHLRFDALVSFATLEAARPGISDQWFFNSFYTFILMARNADAASLQAKLPDFIERRIGRAQKQVGQTYDLSIEPFTRLYLHSEYGTGNLGRQGNLLSVYVFAITALGLLAIACINFVNLSTARSMDRAKEVCMRKVVGSGRFQLVVQFMGESILISLLALALALPICRLLLPLLSQMVGLSESLALSALFVLQLSLVTVVVGVAAGSYPAALLSGFRPIVILSGRMQSGSPLTHMRKALVTFQFVLAVVLVAATLVIRGQLDFLREQELGFEKTRRLIIDFDGDEIVQERREIVAEAMRGHPDILSVSFSSNKPGDGAYSVFSTEIEAGSGEVLQLAMATYMVDFAFFKTYEIELTAGRYFDPEIATDSNEAFVVNEATVRALGLTGANMAIGKTIKQFGRTGKIIGVVQDFNFASLHGGVEPLSLHIRPDWFELITLSYRSGQATVVLNDLKRDWPGWIPHRPLEYSFLDTDINQLYNSERRFGEVVTGFAILAIFINCLGLFGLSAFTVERRSREIGVRKVLGASAGSIIFMLFREYSTLLVIAFSVAVPIAYLALDYWLNDFAYRVSMGPWPFVVGSGLVCVVAFLSICYQSLRGALMNPIESIKYE